MNSKVPISHNHTDYQVLGCLVGNETVRVIIAMIKGNDNWSESFRCTVVIDREYGAYKVYPNEDF